MLVVLVRGDVVQSRDSFPLDLVMLGIELNVLLAVFNLIPIPPLDGSKVASFGLRGDLGDRYDRAVGPYGFLILMVLLMSGALGYIVRPIESLILTVLYALVS